MARMYLYNIKTRSLDPFSGQKRPAYAVLSHRWSDHELSYSDISAGNFTRGIGLAKLKGTIRKAKRDKLNYVWLDTCCINKESSADLSEAINSMYQWYRDAKYCYVYLYDVNQRNPKRPFHKSNWFTRGWTLQELLAPSIVLFYDCKWRLLGDKQSLAREISEVTGIAEAALKTNSLGQYSVAQKMSWAAKRETTVLEDRAYCLIGLFDINMPLLYGEGEKAFLRLQEEIIKDHDDQSIFAWSMGENEFSGLLAPTPRCFLNCGQIVPSISPEGRQPFSMTNRGLSIALQITPWAADTYLAYFNCQVDSPGKPGVGIFLRRLSEDDQYARISLQGQCLWFGYPAHRVTTTRPTREKRLFVRKNIACDEERACLKEREYGFRVSDLQSVYDASLVTSSLSRSSLVWPPGGWGCAVVIDVAAEHQGVRKIALGFDFDFNPVCLLLDPTIDAHHANTVWNSPSDWSRIFSKGFEWEEIHDGGNSFRCAEYDGIWALKGDRLEGLNCILSESFTHKTPLLTLRREEDKFVSAWILEIDSLTGPFRNHQHPQLQRSFFDRRNFQMSYGLGMDPDDLEDGDTLLKALYTRRVTPEQAIPRWVCVNDGAASNGVV